MKRSTSSAETSQIGRSVERLESWLKVGGRAEYVHNLKLPGMLYGKIFRSTVSHGKIRATSFRFEMFASGEYARMLEAGWK